MGIARQIITDTEIRAKADEIEAIYRDIDAGKFPEWPSTKEKRAYETHQYAMELLRHEGRIRFDYAKSVYVHASVPREQVRPVQPSAKPPSGIRRTLRRG